MYNGLMSNLMQNYLIMVDTEVFYTEEWVKDFVCIFVYLI